MPVVKGMTAPTGFHGAGGEEFPLGRLSQPGYSRACMTSKVATTVVVSAGIGIASLVGFILQKEVRARYEAHTMVAVLGDATAQLKGGVKAVPPGALEKLDANLKEVKGWSHVERAAATEEYLVGVREILRRRAEADRLAHKAAASRIALAGHMSRAGGRDSQWIRTASALKKQVERDHFDLNLQLNALAELLESLPQSTKRLAPHVQRSLLFDDYSRRLAHESVLAEAKRAQLQLDKTRSLVPQ